MDRTRVARAANRSSLTDSPIRILHCQERKLKLEVGTNWRPRTSTVKGEGYQFFQGPSPKTSVQEGMPDFFSSDNFADSDAGAGKLFIPLAGVLTLGLAAVLASS
jgi:hypothetical protein